MENFDTLKEQVQTEFSVINDAAALEQFRQKYLSKSGVVAQIYATLATAQGPQKAIIGKNANELRALVTSLIETKKFDSQAKAGNAKSVDITLPGVYQQSGHAHLLTQTVDEILAVFESLGFVVAQTPEMENEFHNFTGLNIPVDHPSRDSFDTFYVNKDDPDQKGRKLLMRSHTSPGQVRLMKMYKPPMAVVIPGKVYRPDAVDASHSFMFHQLEGLLVDENIRFSDLKGLLTEFCRRFFGRDVNMRFRPHFFPFTEPSAEVDIGAEILGIGKKKWLEILGCGMVNPKVFDAVGYPKGKYTGLAFGMGIERMAMLKYRINDIRYFYENDVRFLKQF